jgi:hypothetical protein
MVLTLCKGKPTNAQVSDFFLSYCCKRLVVNLSLRRTELDPRQVHMQTKWHRDSLFSSLQVLRFYPASIVLAKLHIHSILYS